MTALPLPQIILESSPFWVLLFYTYWLVYSNANDQFFLALVIGILIDILQGSILGQNALALILSSAFISKVKLSFFSSNLSTQQVYVFGASSIYLAIILLIHIPIQGLDFSYYLLIAPLSSAIFWPIIKLLISKCRH